MKLALGTSWSFFAVGVWAAPRPAFLGRAGRISLGGLDDLCGPTKAGSGPRPGCIVLQRRVDEPHPSTTSTTHVFTSNSYSTSTRVAQAAPSLGPSPALVNNYDAQVLSSNGSPSNSQLQTIGIIGGLLAGVALIAIIGIMLILLRNQRRARSSTASSSIRTRSRTLSRAHRPPVLTQQTDSSSYPITQPPQLRIYTDRVGTTVSREMTSATAGHNGELHPFPMSSGHDSASSRTTSFGQHSDYGHSGPRRPPQIPSLGLTRGRPFLRSVASAFSYHASVGHSPSVIPEADASVAHGEAATSISGSRTLATTEESGRTVPIENPSEHSAKLSL